MSEASTWDAPEALLTSGLAALEIGLDAGRRSSLLAFLRLLSKWNQVYSLTGVRDPSAMVTYHLLDSLVVLPYLRGRRLLDVGSGAGLPGMVLALVEPDHQWMLLDSNAKKIRFLTQVLIELKPGNVEVVRARVENFHPEFLFTTVITRAFGPLGKVFRLTRRLCEPEARILVMQGTYPAAEIEQPQNSFGQLEVHRLTVPGLAAERHLVVLEV